MTSSSSIHAYPKSRPGSVLDLLPKEPEPVSQTESPLSSSSSSSFSSSMISSLSGEAPTVAISIH
ncbi:MAG TPA: hypothetical protein VGJ00_00135 [Rhabdochlamydiaceae bacterium]